MSRVDIQVVQLPHGADLPLPDYQSADAAGCDLVAAVASPTVICPGCWVTVPTGIAIALPPGIEAQVRPRSGLAASLGVTVLNAPGTIDADYRGEIKVILVNFGQTSFAVERGMRIAQLVFSPILRARWVGVGQLGDTSRDTGGFGSTGVD